METLSLKYLDNETNVAATQVFSALRVKGFDPSDDLQDFPDFIADVIDGTIIHQTIGFRRNFTIEFGTGLSFSERTFIGNFWRSYRKWLIYTHDGISEKIEVVRRTGEFDTIWIDNVHLARYCVLELSDKYVLTDFPSASVNPVVYDLNMYIKKKVQIDGYVGNPETFTTNNGKLASCDAPAGAYPTFNSANEKYHIDINGQVYQDCHFHVTALESVSSGNITFDVERSDAGNPSSDGSYYADIIISVVEIA